MTTAPAPDSGHEDARGEAAVRRSALVEREWPYEWQATFLEALTAMPNVSAAARVAGIARQYAYQVREEQEEFARAWAEAVDVGVDLLERIAHQRGTTGEQRTERRIRRHRERNERGDLVVVEEWTEEIETTYVSDSLLILLLKAHRPAVYRERVDHRHTGDPSQPVVIEEVYRRPNHERIRGLLELAAEHGIELPVIEGTIVRINGDTPTTTEEQT